MELLRKKEAGFKELEEFQPIPFAENENSQGVASRPFDKGD